MLGSIFQAYKNRGVPAQGAYALPAYAAGQAALGIVPAMERTYDQRYDQAYGDYEKAVLGQYTPPIADESQMFGKQDVVPLLIGDLVSRLSGGNGVVEQFMQGRSGLLAQRRQNKLEEQQAKMQQAALNAEVHRMRLNKAGQDRELFEGKVSRGQTLAYNRAKLLAEAEQAEADRDTRLKIAQIGAQGRYDVAGMNNETKEVGQLFTLLRSGSPEQRVLAAGMLKERYGLTDEQIAAQGQLTPREELYTAQKTKALNDAQYIIGRLKLDDARKRKVEMEIQILPDNQRIKWARLTQSEGSVLKSKPSTANLKAYVDIKEKKLQEIGTAIATAQLGGLPEDHPDMQRYKMMYDQAYQEFEEARARYEERVGGGQLQGELAPMSPMKGAIQVEPSKPAPKPTAKPPAKLPAKGKVRQVSGNTFIYGG